MGRLAQLVEHLVYTERVGGSSPSPPTTEVAESRGFQPDRWIERWGTSDLCIRRVSRDSGDKARPAGPPPNIAVGFVRNARTNAASLPVQAAQVVCPVKATLRCDPSLASNPARPYFEHSRHPISLCSKMAPAVGTRVHRILALNLSDLSDFFVCGCFL